MSGKRPLSKRLVRALQQGDAVAQQTPDRRESVARRIYYGKTGHRIGESHPNATLTFDEVAAIKARLADGASKSEIARDFDVSRRTIQLIASGKRWGAKPNAIVPVPDDYDGIFGVRLPDKIPAFHESADLRETMLRAARELRSVLTQLRRPGSRRRATNLRRTAMTLVTEIFYQPLKNVEGVNALTYADEIARLVTNGAPAMDAAAARRELERALREALGRARKHRGNADYREQLVAYLAARVRHALDQAVDSDIMGEVIARAVLKATTAP